jgi:hypothetical protein
MGGGGEFPNSTSIFTPRAAHKMLTFFCLPKKAAAPCVVGEKSSKVTLMAPWTIVFRIRTWQVAKVVVPLNDTRTKRGQRGSGPYRFTEDHVILVFFQGGESINHCWTNHVLVSMVVNEGGRQWHISVDGSGRQAGGLFPHCCWRW